MVREETWFLSHMFTVWLMEARMDGFYLLRRFISDVPNG